ncbi:hypothetical protein GCM10027292_29140 [Hydrogenophaga aquatica]
MWKNFYSRIVAFFVLIICSAFWSGDAYSGALEVGEVMLTCKVRASDERDLCSLTDDGACTRVFVIYGQSIDEVQVDEGNSVKSLVILENNSAVLSAYKQLMAYLDGNGRLIYEKIIKYSINRFDGQISEVEEYRWPSGEVMSKKQFDEVSQKDPFRLLFPYRAGSRKGVCVASTKKLF